MAGDDLINFPTPAEAFGRSQRKTSQPHHEDYQHYQRSDGPPLHPTQSTQSHPRPSTVPNASRPIRQHPNHRPSSQSLRDQYGQQQQQQIPSMRSSRNTSHSDAYNTPSYHSRNGYDSPQVSSNGFQQQHQQQPPPPPPPIVNQQQQQNASQMLERQLRDLFDRVDRDRDGKLTENELSIALLNNDGTQFQSSTLRLMIRLFDTDGSGTIEFREFYHLWNYLLHWRKTFQRFDVDQNQRISFGEYQTALESFGYRLPTDIVLFIFQKFGDFNSNKPMFLRFDMFVESLVWLLRCTNVFKKFDSQGNGIATIPFQDFVHEIISFI